jgi:pyruvate ferredoxin oxidoreductase delta subunit
MASKLKGWRELPPGGIIIEAGNSEKYRTGDWRTFKPVIDLERCSHCLLCWIYCPDSSVIVKEGRIRGIDYDHCKGCGICAEECPPKIRAIRMLRD